jgi:polar amino acid transport system substrate-binding protein
MKNKLSILGGLTGLLMAAAFISPAHATGRTCSTGLTIKEGVLTIATGNPAYFPWVMDDAPESGAGFEAAVAYAVAEKMGFDKDKVEWTRTSFDQSIQPGPKDFDFNLQQFSITPEREQVVDFSDAYFSSPMAVLIRKPTMEAGATATMESLKSLKWGAGASTTAYGFITNDIAPESEILLYDDVANVTEALKAGQIDAGLFDLPTALFTAAVLLDDGIVLGQFPASIATNPDQFGLLMANESPLKPCVNEGITRIKEDGTLAKIEAEWLQTTTGVPLISK